MLLPRPFLVTDTVSGDGHCLRTWTTRWLFTVALVLLRTSARRLLLPPRRALSGTWQPCVFKAELPDCWCAGARNALDYDSGDFGDLPRYLNVFSCLGRGNPDLSPGPCSRVLLLLWLHDGALDASSSAALRLVGTTTAWRPLWLPSRLPLGAKLGSPGFLAPTSAAARLQGAGLGSSDFL